MERFAGDVEEIADVSAIVDILAIVPWIKAIPFEDWPQQPRLADLMLRPAMACDPDWYGFGRITDPLVADLMRHFPGCSAHKRMLSVVMPGHEIEPHRDEQPPSWRCRVHVPLMTNHESVFIVGRWMGFMEPGFAYRVNTEAVHAVINEGREPRIHFLFDVRLGDH